jgi:hypothetical protein
VQLKRGAAFQPDAAAKAVYDATWNRQTRLQVYRRPAYVIEWRVPMRQVQRPLTLIPMSVCPRLQRDFVVFGGEFLMIQGAQNLRGFFDSFFKLPEGMWTVRTQEPFPPPVFDCSSTVKDVNPSPLL